MTKRIFLIGFMGSGKTTLGQQLADKLNIPFYDLDEVLVDTWQMSIPDMFERWGEITFRQKEAEALRKFNQVDTPFVLSCGGGTPCFHQNMAWMNLHGYTLFLDPPIALLRARLEGSEELRPVLKKHSEQKSGVHWEELLENRRPFYLQAASRLASEHINLDEVIHMLNS